MVQSLSCSSNDTQVWSHHVKPTTGCFWWRESIIYLYIIYSSPRHQWWVYVSTYFSTSKINTTKVHAYDLTQGWGRSFLCFPFLLRKKSYSLSKKPLHQLQSITVSQTMYRFCPYNISKIFNGPLEDEFLQHFTDWW